MPDHPKLYRSLERNLNELQQCILKRRAYNQLLLLRPKLVGLSFFDIVISSLHGDMFGDAFRVFDMNKESASYFYVKKIAGNRMRAAEDRLGLNLAELEEIAAKLPGIRNRVGFHMDKRSIMNTEKVWEDANLTGNEFIRLTEEIHELLRQMLVDFNGRDMELRDYNAEDIELILGAYREKHPKKIDFEGVALEMIGEKI